MSYLKTIISYEFNSYVSSGKELVALQTYERSFVRFRFCRNCVVSYEFVSGNRVGKPLVEFVMRQSFLKRFYFSSQFVFRPDLQIDRIFFSLRSVRKYSEQRPYEMHERHPRPRIYRKQNGLRILLVSKINESVFFGDESSSKYFVSEFVYETFVFVYDPMFHLLIVLEHAGFFSVVTHDVVHETVSHFGSYGSSVFQILHE